MRHQLFCAIAFLCGAALLAAPSSRASLRHASDHEVGGQRPGVEPPCVENEPVESKAPNSACSEKVVTAVNPQDNVAFQTVFLKATEKDTVCASSEQQTNKICQTSSPVCGGKAWFRSATGSGNWTEWKEQNVDCAYKYTKSTTKDALCNPSPPKGGE